MDKAASIAVDDIIKSPAVTVTVSRINFLKPIHNGDIFTIYTEITAIGTSSITIYVSVEVKNLDTNQEYEVTSAEFKFVAINDKGKPVNVRSVIRNDIDTHIKTLLH
jgi:acyl-CoA thioesterase YciA